MREERGVRVQGPSLALSAAGQRAIKGPSSPGAWRGVAGTRPSRVHTKRKGDHGDRAASPPLAGRLLASHTLRSGDGLVACVAAVAAGAVGGNRRLLGLIAWSVGLETLRLLHKQEQQLLGRVPLTLSLGLSSTDRCR